MSEFGHLRITPGWVESPTIAGVDTAAMIPSFAFGANGGVLGLGLPNSASGADLHDFHS
jgi:hypothetical protein